MLIIDDQLLQVFCKMSLRMACQSLTYANFTKPWINWNNNLVLICNTAWAHQIEWELGVSLMNLIINGND